MTADITAPMPTNPEALREGSVTEPTKPTDRLLRLLPLGAIALGAAVSIWLFGDQLSFEALERNYEALLAWRDGNWALAAATYFAIYVLVVAFSVPGAVWLTLLGGFLFGTAAGTAIVVAAATLGATLIFLAARTAIGDWLRARAGGWVTRLESGFRDGEISFLLIMRLVPAVPFFVANLAPAFLGARLSTFMWTTFLGIIPGTLVYISVGAGLGAQLARGERPDLGIIFEWHVLGPLLGLALLAALPLVLKRLGLIRQG
ncbi:MAG: TVP38/TMEM64 family protein [Pseudomonadota bacterium]